MWVPAKVLLASYWGKGGKQERNDRRLPRWAMVIVGTVPFIGKGIAGMVPSREPYDPRVARQTEDQIERLAHYRPFC